MPAENKQNRTTHQKPYTNRRPNTCDGTGPDFFLGQPQIGTDLGEQRRNGEPNEERDEEGPPRAMKGTHMRAGKATQSNFSCFIILLGVRIKLIGWVFLPPVLAGRNFKVRHVGNRGDVLLFYGLKARKIILYEFWGCLFAFSFWMRSMHGFKRTTELLLPPLHVQFAYSSSTS